MTPTTRSGPARERGRTTATDWQPQPSGDGHTIFLDLDTVLLASHPGRRGVELGVQADLADGIDRLAEVADHIVVLAFPAAADEAPGAPTEQRLETLRHGLGTKLDELLVVSCPHTGDDGCDCAKPGSGLVRLALEEHALPGRGGWYIGADQAGVVSGRGAGLRTVRIGPVGDDHLSNVHRPDYEARDLLDAANHILLEELS